MILEFIIIFICNIGVNYEKQTTVQHVTELDSGMTGGMIAHPVVILVDRVGNIIKL